jgi:hypothetical protein
MFIPLVMDGEFELLEKLLNESESHFDHKFCHTFWKYSTICSWLRGGGVGITVAGKTGGLTEHCR